MLEFIGDKPTTIRGYPFRVIPLCFATGLKLAKSFLYNGIWYIREDFVKRLEENTYRAKIDEEREKKIRRI